MSGGAAEKPDGIVVVLPQFAGGPHCAASGVSDSGLSASQTYRFRPVPESTGAAIISARSVLRSPAVNTLSSSLSSQPGGIIGPIAVTSDRADPGPSVAELWLAFLDHAERSYIKGGKSTDEHCCPANGLGVSRNIL